MQTASGGRTGLGAALLASLLLNASTAYPQDRDKAKAGGNKEEVSFRTVDRVQLRGSFYPGRGGNKAACVLLVPNIGSDRDKAGWEELAEALQQKGYAVLTFDFRGHGESTEVDPALFWHYTANLTHIKGANRTKDHIAVKDFLPGYYPWMANDLAAARLFLDQKSNDKACNSSSLILVGAEQGAALAALWTYTEFLRPRLAKNTLGVLAPIGPPEGNDIQCAVWLSIPQRFNNVYVGSWLKEPVRSRVAMGFLYGKEDAGAASAAKVLLDVVKGGKQAALDDKLGLETKAAGAGLLGKQSLKTQDQVITYIDGVMEKRKTNNWTQRELPTDPTLVPLQQWFFSLRR